MADTIDKDDATPATEPASEESSQQEIPLPPGLPAGFQAARRAFIPVTKMPGYPAPEDTVQRTWSDLIDLDVAGITDIYNNLIQRCTESKANLAAAISKFESCNTALRNSSTRTSLDPCDTYIKLYNDAQKAGAQLFAPQEVYRNALALLVMFLDDLIARIPVEGGVKEKVRAEFATEMWVANQVEVSVRVRIFALSGYFPRGNEKRLVMEYVCWLKMRVDVWGKAEGKLKRWVEECLAALG